MKLDPVSKVHSLQVGLIAFATFLVVAVLAWLFRTVFRLASARSRRFLPPRLSRLIGFTVAVLLFWTVVTGVFFRVALHTLDLSFAEYDALIEPERPPPANPTRPGSAASLLKWEDLGRTGRKFVTSGPTAAEISASTGRAALDPIRVYAGLRSAETVEQRARLALDELRRVGAFDRSTLVVITPTGTGWIDPAAIDSLEYLQDGDVASVALQYSYLSSPLSLFVEQERGTAAARALFVEIYKHWSAMPKAGRPRLYLFGLSLGSLYSEKSLKLFEMLGDPVDGALWSGPTFKNELWRSATDDRIPASPAWLPRFGDDGFVRFHNQNGSSVPADARWQTMRIVYLQYASDPVTFFDYRDSYRGPDWMMEPRGPDVSPDMRWYPIVTMLQIAFDMAMATTTPVGYGHVYAPEHYLDAWMTLTGAEGWTVERIEKLKQHLRQRMLADMAQPSGENPYEDRGG